MFTRKCRERKQLFAADTNHTTMYLQKHIKSHWYFKTVTIKRNTHTFNHYIYTVT